MFKASLKNCNLHSSMGTLGLSSHKVEKEFEEGIEKLEAMHQELTMC